MKPNTLFKRAFNAGLSRLADFAPGDDLGSEPQWAAALGVSRTTIRAVLARMAERGLIELEGRRKVLLRAATADDFFDAEETQTIGAQVEQRFMQWILNGDRRPGETINVLELSRRFGVSAPAVREYLNRLRPFGLVERRPTGAWVLNGFTEDFAEELCEVRALFELRSSQRFAALADDDPAWGQLRRIRAEHVALLAQDELKHEDFSALDARFHRCLNDAARNRFIAEFYEAIAMVFHYHYQWSKHDGRARNVAALREHLAYIDALLARDAEAAAKACRAHLQTARATLLASLQPAQD